MTKQELVRVLVDRSQATQAQTRSLLAELEGVAVEELAASGRFDIIGLCSFRCVDRASPRMRSPRTGEMIDVPARRGVSIRPSSRLKAEVERLASA